MPGALKLGSNRGMPVAGTLSRVCIPENRGIINRVKKINRNTRRFGEPGVAGKTVQRADLDNLELTYGAETYMAFLGLARSTHPLNIAKSRYIYNLQIAYYQTIVSQQVVYAFIHAAFHDF